MGYIHNNPVQAGYCKNENDWKYSSASFYQTGEESAIPIERLV